jgi:hypothetical protein
MKYYRKFKLTPAYFEAAYMSGVNKETKKIPLNQFEQVLNQGVHDEVIKTTWEAINNDPVKRGDSVEGKLRIVINKAQYEKLFQEGLVHEITDE